jgi:hypothetical protein
MIAALIALYLGTQPALASGSSYLSDPSTTWVLTKNTWYWSNAMQATGVPGTLTNVQWQFQTSYPVPTGHVEQLCDQTWGQCLWVTGLGTGSTSVFNGRPATDVFQFRFAVNGTGSISSYYFTNKHVTLFY